MENKCFPNLGSLHSYERRLLFDNVALNPETAPAVEAAAEQTASAESTEAADVADDTDAVQAGQQLASEAESDSAMLERNARLAKELESMTQSVGGTIDNTDAGFIKKQIAERAPRLQELSGQITKAQKDVQETWEALKPFNKKDLSEEEQGQKKGLIEKYNAAKKKLEDLSGELNGLKQAQTDDGRKIEDMEHPPKTDEEAYQRDIARAGEDFNNASGILGKLMAGMKYLGAMISMYRGMMLGTPHPDVGKTPELVTRKERRESLKNEIKNSAKNPEGSLDSLLAKKEDQIKQANSKLSAPDTALNEAQAKFDEAEKTYNEAVKSNFSDDAKKNANTAMESAKQNLEKEKARVSQANENTLKEKGQLESEIKELKEWKQEVEKSEKTLNEGLEKISKVSQLNYLEGVRVSVAQDGISLEWRVDPSAAAQLKQEMGQERYDALVEADGKVNNEQKFEEAITEIANGKKQTDADAVSAPASPQTEDTAASLAESAPAPASAEQQAVPSSPAEQASPAVAEAQPPAGAEATVQPVAEAVPTSAPESVAPAPTDAPVQAETEQAEQKPEEPAGDKRKTERMTEDEYDAMLIEKQEAYRQGKAKIQGKMYEILGKEAADRGVTIRQYSENGKNIEVAININTARQNLKGTDYFSIINKFDYRNQYHDYASDKVKYLAFDEVDNFLNDLSTVA
ncbi:MAG: hypothetical protein UX30_C0004G0047 [Candidatus Saccharibacteria bacterium GW2011_GWA2_46_10]|nr:MAG: hypothetical protein UX30_C0004G0047 [Candidatus Saccharibacteria bacterium GW2011_GWA2_46_10]